MRRSTRGRPLRNRDAIAKLGRPGPRLADPIGTLRDGGWSTLGVEEQGFKFIGRGGLIGGVDDPMFHHSFLERSNDRNQSGET